ncbi:MAG: DUF962 domain-containing protein [Bdellovibrionales bacterium]|nr:DUF962 domain-containing protein [Bdellovibrionales bacterium]
MAERKHSFREFWPFYLSQHLNPICRALHYAGTLTAVGLLLLFLISGEWFKVPLAILPGYSFAWIGHFGFEGNRPATFKYPLWSFRADFVMLWCFLTGKLSLELSQPDVQGNWPVQK